MCRWERGSRAAATEFRSRKINRILMNAKHSHAGVDCVGSEIQFSHAYHRTRRLRNTFRVLSKNTFGFHVILTRLSRRLFLCSGTEPGWRSTISRANLIAATRFALIKSPPQDLCNNSRKSIAVNWILAQLHTIRLARLSANANICDPKRNVLHRPRKRQTWHFIINNKMLYADYESSVCLIRFTPNTFPLSLRRSRHYGFSGLR